MELGWGSFMTKVTALYTPHQSFSLSLSPIESRQKSVCPSARKDRGHDPDYPFAALVHRRTIAYSLYIAKGYTGGPE
jgi:hypothetical protein